MKSTKKQIQTKLIKLMHLLLISAIFIIPTEIFSQQSALSKKITEKAIAIYDEMVQIRRDIHAHPELSGSEVRTAQIVADKLREYGLEVKTNVGGHGIVGILRGKQDKPVVAYRADMDAMNQNLNENVSFKSIIPGVNHVCGHDVHTAVALGTANALSSMKDVLFGTVVFIFQPAEETIEGAKKMIADDVLDNPKPDAIFALHVAPFEAGSMATTPGVGLPGLEKFTISLKGNIALSDLTNEIIRSINSKVSTIKYPNTPQEFQMLMEAIMTDKSILSDFVFSPAWSKDSNKGEVIIEGFLRASSEDNSKKAKDKIKNICKVPCTNGIQFSFESVNSCPPTFSNYDLGLWASKPLEDILGKQNALRVYESFPFNSEDFGFYLQKIPGHMFWLGGSNSKKNILALPHAPMFSVDEQAILAGIKGMSNVLVQYLENNKNN